MVTFHPKPTHSRFKDLDGRRFLVVGFAGCKPQAWWLCRCDCGNEKEVRGYVLTSGATQSCGCLHKEGLSKLMHIHGESIHTTPEYRTWKDMIMRCRPRAENKNHGARGIFVCERWGDSYQAFLSDMGRRPSERHSIERINNDGNYEPGNGRRANAEHSPQSSNHLQGRNALRDGLGEKSGLAAPDSSRSTAPQMASR